MELKEIKNKLRILLIRMEYINKADKAKTITTYLNDKWNKVNKDKATIIITTTYDKDGLVKSEQIDVKGNDIKKGGEGSGNFNHEGRPGMVGGSGEGGDNKNQSTIPVMRIKNNNDLKKAISIADKNIPDYIKKYSAMRGIRINQELQPAKDSEINGYKCAASFNTSTREIKFYELQENAKSDQLTFNHYYTHELGHGIMDGIEGTEAYDSWGTKYATIFRGLMPTSYSEVSSSEGFAESFSAYYRQEKLATPIVEYFNKLDTYIKDITSGNIK